MDLLAEAEGSVVAGGDDRHESDQDGDPGQRRHQIPDTGEITAQLLAFLGHGSSSHTGLLKIILFWVNCQVKKFKVEYS